MRRLGTLAYGFLVFGAACSVPEAASSSVALTPGPGIPNADRPASELYQRVSPIMGSRHLNQPAVVNQTLLLAGNGVHEIWNIKDPSAPVRMAELSSPHRFGEAESHQVSFARLPDGSLHAATISGRGVDLWNISNPESPTLESALVLEGITYGDFTSAVWGVAWQGRYLYVGGTNTGLHIVDTLDTTAPVVLKRLPTSAFGGISAGPLFTLGNLLVITTPKESSGIATLDITDPRNPALLDLVDPAEKSYIGAFYGKHAYLQSPLRAYDVVTDPRNITLSGTTATPSSEYLSFGDFSLFLGTLRTSAGGMSGLLKYDATLPGSPTLMGHIRGRNDPGTDDQFSVPIGNLVVVADDEHLYGAWLAVHATARDTTPPAVLHMSPKDEATHLAIGSRIGVSFSDQIELASVQPQTFIVRPVGGAQVAGRFGLTHTLLSFWPELPLEPATTYEIVLPQGGIKDLVGNGIAAEVRTTFTTASAPVTGPPCAIDASEPVEVGAPAELRATAADEARYAYRFNLGDGRSADGPRVVHPYAAPGRYAVALTVTERISSPASPHDHYDAEGATLKNGVAASTEWPGFSGTGFADYPAAGGAVAWPGVLFADAGSYRVEIRYANGDAASATRHLGLLVDGTRVATLDFAASANDWASWRTVAHDLTLSAGSHVIELHADAGTAGPNIDRLSVPQLGSTTCSATQIVHRPLTPARPTRASTVVLASGRVCAVNPDSNTVSCVDRATHARVWEAEAGKHPRTLARAPDGTLWVANQDEDTLSVLDAQGGALLATVALPYGSAPYGIAFAPDGRRGFVTLQGSGRLVVVDPAARALVGSVDLGAPVRGLAVSADSARIFVSRFVSPPEGGEVYEVAAASLRRTRTITLGDAPGPDTPDQARGIPNYLGAITVSPDGAHAWLPSKQDNLRRGLARDGQALTHDSAVRPIVSRIDLAESAEAPGARIDLNDKSMPLAAETSRHGDLLFIALQGNDRVEVRNAYDGSVVASLPTGSAPEGLVLDDEGRLYVQDFLGRSLTIVDVSAILRGLDDVAAPLATVPLSAREPLSTEVLLGKRIFHNASDPRMSKEAYISCASCHLDGDQDGRVWDFTDRGEGLRNTISLLGRAGTGHGRLHWTANFDEIQDFENDMRNAFGGTGFLDDAVFQSHRAPLGPPKAGLSPELDALAAYAASLTSVSRSPHRTPEGGLTADARAGRAIFAALDCASCHAGDTFTDGERHDGIDTPTLYGLFSSAPYFHDGSAATLRQVLDRPHGSVSDLTPADKDRLVAYLNQLDQNGDVDARIHQPGSGCACAASGRAPGSAASLVLLVLLVLLARISFDERRASGYRRRIKEGPMLRILGLGTLLMAASGCTYLAATPSVQGRAFVTRNEWVSSSFWNCDASSGEPVCYQTKKQFTQQPAAK